MITPEEEFLKTAEDKMRELLNEAVSVKRKKKFWAKQNNHYQNQRNRQVDISVEELIKIQNFYKNCPRGYVVDHVVPLSEGGKHQLSNLQYFLRAREELILH